MNCYIIDDEQHAVDMLRQHIKASPALNLVGYSLSPVEGLAAIANIEERPLLLFLDIDMPELSGLDLIPLLDRGVSVILTTAHLDFAAVAFEHDVLDFLHKPISLKRFLQSIAKAEAKLSTSSASTARRYFFVQVGGKGKLTKVYFDKIIFIEAKQNYLLIQLDDEKLMPHLTMKQMEDELPAGQFMRVHKSYIINLDRLESLDAGDLHLGHGHVVPVGALYKDALMARISSAVLRNKRFGRE